MKIYRKAQCIGSPNYSIWKYNPINSTETHIATYRTYGSFIGIEKWIAYEEPPIGVVETDISYKEAQQLVDEIEANEFLENL